MLPERKQQILVVDDEPNLRRVLSAQLARDGYDVHTAEDGEEGLSLLREHHIDLVITDLRMPKLDGLELLRHALRIEAELPVVVITAHGTVDNAVEALKSGAFDYITKPFDQAEVRAIVRKALDTRRLALREVWGRASGAVDFGLVGQSESVRALREQLANLAETLDPVALVGESGTGKEVAARALHDRSPRRDKPFVKVNCAAIAPAAIGEELFGQPRGSGGRPGRLELAAAGTLFLDEIGSVPFAVQEQLLRAIEHGSYERPGGVGPIAANARIMVAARQPLSELQQQHVLSPSLGQLLERRCILLTPLRERQEDIAAITAGIIAELNAKFGKHVSQVSPEVSEVLLRHPWPGNIRELENVLERAVLLCEHDVVTSNELPPELVNASTTVEEALGVGPEDQGLRAQVKAITVRVERQLIQQALQQTRGNVTHAARLLKVSRKGLQLKMKELGLREREE